MKTLINKVNIENAIKNDDLRTLLIAAKNGFDFTEKINDKYPLQIAIENHCLESTIFIALWQNQFVFPKLEQQTRRELIIEISNEQNNSSKKGKIRPAAAKLDEMSLGMYAIALKNYIPENEITTEIICALKLMYQARAPKLNKEADKLNLDAKTDIILAKIEKTNQFINNLLV